jgi:hypothetical protein
MASVMTDKGSERVEKPYEEEEKKVYTNLFFQRQLSFKQAASWVFVHYLTIGLIQGYFVSVQFNLQAEGATFKDQSTLTLAVYPYSFKFIISPFLDRFYFWKVGRSKTYIVIGGTVIASAFLFLGPTIGRMVKEKDVVPLTLLFALINSLVCVVQIAGESWILTMFSKEEKTKASTFLSIGQSMGVLMGYNIFTPLNDVAWLNDNVFVNDPRTTPLVSHSMLCFFISFLYLSQIIVNMLFISEEKILDKKAKKILNILSIVPRHVTNSHMRKFILYIFACRFFYYQIDFSLDLKLVKNGYLNISRSTISNIDTLTYPIVFSLSFCTIYFMKKGQLIRMFHLNMFVVILTGTFRFLNYIDLINNRNMTITIIARVLSGILTGMDFGTFFLMSFFNTIVNKSVGNTGITCLIALMNQTGSISRTVGLYMISQIQYEIFVPCCLIGEFIVLVLLYPYSAVLDNKESKLYSFLTQV